MLILFFCGTKNSFLSVRDDSPVSDVIRLRIGEPISFLDVLYLYLIPLNLEGL